jgi:uroporphyrin-III C-methyltransferase / precorrin-2 dehydrogenase / sirohydrochlorin ferrochelatase
VRVVTSPVAPAADLELPLTLRGVASSLVFTTGHDLRGETLPDWARLAVGGATVAVYMGRSVAAEISVRLVEAGLSAETPVAVVENASLESRRLLKGRLFDLTLLEDRDDLSGPVLTVIGEAVAAANLQTSEPLAARLAAQAA